MRGTVVIIGAGFGGLSCAVRLAAGGWKVTVLERQSAPGGKLQRIEQDGYTFDRGPSTITMPHVFRSLYELAGARMEDYVSLYELEPRTRNVFADGTVVDLSKNRAFMREQIAAYSPGDAGRYNEFLDEAGELYRLSNRRFLNRPMLSWRDKLAPGLLRAWLRVRPLVRLEPFLRRYFKHPNTLAMFGRYATYVGSSPYEAPSIFAMLGSAEAEEGIYGVRGGTYRLVEGLLTLARELGVTVVTNTEAKQIRLDGGRVTGVETADRFYPADRVVIGGDAVQAAARLLPDRAEPGLKPEAYEPSLSGMVLLAGVGRRYDALLHHTVFFPETYRDEFLYIFGRRMTPPEPAVYVCHSGYTESGMAPEGASNLFILANAPYLSEACDWREEKHYYADRILSVLENHGIKGVREAEVLIPYTPQDIAADTLAYKGAIYGISSNSVRQTFFRPGNKSRGVKGLWYVGGTTHPGGGTPIVSLSGRMVAETILGGG